MILMLLVVLASAYLIVLFIVNTLVKMHDKRRESREKELEKEIKIELLAEKEAEIKRLKELLALASGWLENAEKQAVETRKTLQNNIDFMQECSEKNHELARWLTGSLSMNVAFLRQYGESEESISGALERLKNNTPVVTMKRQKTVKKVAVFRMQIELKQ